MQIVLITHYFDPEVGAPQRRWSALVARFVRAGHSVSVFAPPPHYPDGRVHPTFRKRMRPGSVASIECGAMVHRVGYVPHYGDIVTRTIDHLGAAISTVRAVRTAMRETTFSPDVVVATAPAIESLLAGRLVSRMLSVPMVAEMRDAWPDLVAFTPGMQTARSPISWAKKQVHRAVTDLQSGAAAVVTTTDSFATVLRERGMRHVEVLRNGTTHTEYPRVPSSHFTDGVLRVLYMGTVGRSQGLDLVVATVARLQAEGVAIECRIVGGGADLPRLTRLNRALGSPVAIIRAVDPSEVRDHYAWADSAIVSLRDWEPFAWTVPSKLYELLATGKHITAIVEGEAADIVASTRGGAVVKPGDATALAALWRKLSADRSDLEVDSSGRAWVEENADYDALSDRYLQLLARVVSENATP